MDIIVAEKPIAGKRIAELLSKGKMQLEKENNVELFKFELKGKEFILIPLKGHILDVDFPSRFAPWIGTDVNSLIKAKILYIEKEKAIINLLKKFGKNCSLIIIATDSDREGESIGLEAIKLIKEVNQKVKVLRANFSAITEQEINQAFEKLNEFDVNLAESADTRREIDLIWGAVLTRFLSIVSGKLGSEFLSAGRVQSPTLALIVDREKERMKFKPEKYFEIEALLEKDKIKFSALHEKGRIKDKSEAEKIIEKKESPLTVIKLEKKEKSLSKPLPFNTTEFLRAASAIGISATKAMDLAEFLYQKGYTSYPRTDNTVYPESLDLREILKILSEAPEFKEMTEKLLSKKQLIPSAGKKATKDHPPIHPVAVPKEKLEPQAKKIYDLIVHRFFATLADEAKVLAVKAVLNMNNEKFIAHGLTYISLGWKEFYPYTKIEETILPEMKEGDKVKLIELKLLEKETKPPARFSQGTLIQLMEKLNLGTKSTRHETLKKLYARKYISGIKQIIPNNVSFAVIDALEKYDGLIVKPEMTANLEKEMDLIAAGKKTKNQVVEESREMLEKVLAELMKNKDKIGSEIRKALTKDTILGKCLNENCSGNLIIRKGFSGKRFVGCTEYPKCKLTFPLPQKGQITVTEKKCPECNAPIIKLSGKRYSFELCINMNCKTKDEWKKKQQENAKKQNSNSEEGLNS